MRGRTWRNDIEGLYICSYSRCVFHSFTYCHVSALLLVAGWVPFAQILEEG